MSKYKIQSHEALKREMKAVARGEKPAPADANQPSFNSADVLLRVLTPENRILLRLIRDKRPESVAELARLSQRAEPNLLRTLAKLEAIGLVKMETIGRRKKPVSRARVLRVEIDPYSQNDKLEVA
jgi:predicted transcriptional regulator